MYLIFSSRVSLTSFILFSPALLNVIALRIVRLAMPLLFHTPQISIRRNGNQQFVFNVFVNDKAVIGFQKIPNSRFQIYSFCPMTYGCGYHRISKPVLSISQAKG